MLSRYVGTDLASTTDLASSIERLRFRVEALCRKDVQLCRCCKVEFSPLPSLLYFNAGQAE